MPTIHTKEITVKHTYIGDYPKLTVAQMKKRLDVLLKTVRYLGEDCDGQSNVCVTCRKRFPIKELQCGHFIKRGNQVLKYDSHNVWPQCARCNHFLGGAQDKMAYETIRRLGFDEFERLVETDRSWQEGELPNLKRVDLAEAYNYWLDKTRMVERQFSVQLVPESWENTN